MRGAKVRSADTLEEWSSALLLATGPTSLREYIDQEDAGKLNLSGGIMLGPLLLSADAINNMAAVPLRQHEQGLADTISFLVGAAPQSLNNIEKLATALGNDPNIITSLINNKADLAGAVFTGPVEVLGTLSNVNQAVNYGNVVTMIDSIPTTVFDTGNFDEVPSGAGVNAVRNINLTSTGVVAGTYTKLEVDAFGRVLVGSQFQLSDLPELTVGGSPVAMDAYILQIGSALNNYAPLAGSVFTGQVDVADMFRVNTSLTPDNTVEIHPPVGGVMSTAGVLFRLSGVVVQGVKVRDDYQLVAHSTYTLDPAEPNAVILQSHLDAALASVVDGAEDSWVGDGGTLWFPYSNISGTAASASPGRVFVFIDGVFQRAGHYIVGPTGIEFAVAPQNLSEIEARHIN